MIPIHELLNRIRWDPEFGKGDFVVGYYDRVGDRIVRVPFRQIVFGRHDHLSFQAVENDGSIHTVPLHRVREVWHDGELIWQRHLKASSREKNGNTRVS